MQASCDQLTYNCNIKTPQKAVYEKPLYFYFVFNSSVNKFYGVQFSCPFFLSSDRGSGMVQKLYTCRMNPWTQPFQECITIRRLSGGTCTR